MSTSSVISDFPQPQYLCIELTLLLLSLPYRPGFKRQLMFQDVTAKYCIYDKVPSLPMSFFVRIKGCVNCRTTTSVKKKRVLTR